ncbi:MAG: hypothetical protein E7220_05570 [Clostridiales bacterium]|nr:hypothetical protein [Clostridiales bacterium]
MMKRIVRLTVSLVLSLVLMMPLLGTGEVFAAGKPGKASLPDRVIVKLYNNKLAVRNVNKPKYATSVRFYLKANAKYIKTVKKGSKAYKKYRRNKKKYILKKSGKKYKVYRKIKGAKWKKINMIDDGSWDQLTYVYQTQLGFNKQYMFRCRGVNDSGAGSYSKTLTFYTQSKAQYKSIKSKFNKDKAQLDPEDEYHLLLEALQDEYSDFVYMYDDEIPNEDDYPYEE